MRAKLYDVLETGVAVAAQSHAAQRLPCHLWSTGVREADGLGRAVQARKSDLPMPSTSYLKTYINRNVSMA